MLHLSGGHGAAPVGVKRHRVAVGRPAGHQREVPGHGSLEHILRLTQVPSGKGVPLLGGIGRLGRSFPLLYCHGLHRSNAFPKHKGDGDQFLRTALHKVDGIGLRLSSILRGDNDIGRHTESAGLHNGDGRIGPLRLGRQSRQRLTGGALHGVCPVLIKPPQDLLAIQGDGSRGEVTALLRRFLPVDF